MAGIKIEKAEAMAVFAEALALARSKVVLPDEWVERTRKVSASESATLCPTLGTAMLAKATNPDVDARALKASVHKGYSARGLATAVLVPCCEEAGIDIRTTGAEPLNNQPVFGKDRIDETVKVHHNVTADWKYLCECVAKVDFLKGKSAVQAFAAFLRARIEATESISDVPLGEGVLGLHDLADALDEFVEAFSEGGKVGQAIVTAILSVAHNDVRTKRINDPSVSWPGDVGIFSDGSLWTSVEVKQRPFTSTEILQFAKRLKASTAHRAVIVALAQGHEPLEEAAVMRSAYRLHRIHVSFYFKMSELLLPTVHHSQRTVDSILEDFQETAMAQLVAIETSDDVRNAWARIFATG